jgi:hypothetical protein
LHAPVASACAWAASAFAPLTDLRALATATEPSPRQSQSQCCTRLTRYGIAVHTGSGLGRLAIFSRRLGRCSRSFGLNQRCDTGRLLHGLAEFAACTRGPVRSQDNLRCERIGAPIATPRSPLQWWRVCDCVIWVFWCRARMARAREHGQNLLARQRIATCTSTIEY